MVHGTSIPFPVVIYTHDRASEKKKKNPTFLRCLRDFTNSIVMRQQNYSQLLRIIACSPDLFGTYTIIQNTQTSPMWEIIDLRPMI